MLSKSQIIHFRISVELNEQIKNEDYSFIEEILDSYWQVYKFKFAFHKLTESYSLYDEKIH